MTTVSADQPWIPIIGKIVQPEPTLLDVSYDSGKDVRPLPHDSFWSKSSIPQYPCGEVLDIPKALGASEFCSVPKTLDSHSRFGGLSRQCDPHQVPDPIVEFYSQAFHCMWPDCRARTRSFLFSSDLDQHIRTYHLRRCPWPTCSIRKPFRRRSDLTRHVQSVHSGGRKHCCDVPGCGKVYARSDKLTAHKRIHNIHTASAESSPSTTPLVSVLAPTLPMDNPASHPLRQWFTGNDGPWIPNGISAISGFDPEAIYFAGDYDTEVIPMGLGSPLGIPLSFPDSHVGCDTLPRSRQTLTEPPYACRVAAISETVSKTGYCPIREPPIEREQNTVVPRSQE